jgi:hypothetical protein
VSHIDPVILALRALGGTAGAADDTGHTETCPGCRAELARLSQVVDVAGHAGPAERLETPPPQVWDRIAAAVGSARAIGDPAGDGAVSAEDGASAGTGTAVPGREPRARRGLRARKPRGRLATGLAGLAVGLIIGIGGTAGITQLAKAPATRMVAEIQLSPLPEFPQWQDASGTAVMRATASQQEIVITLHAPGQARLLRGLAAGPRRSEHDLPR